MRYSFSDITLYTPSPHKVGTPEYIEETALQNFVSDLYVQNMKGYKPPKTTRITIQPAYHEVWNRTWKIGSIVSIAPYFDYDTFKALDKFGKYKYVLDLIQSATIPLSDEYGWDRTVFENAYSNVLNSNFKFVIEYPKKQSKDKANTAWLSVQKTEMKTTLFANITSKDTQISKQLIEKENRWWYDCIYTLIKHDTWFDIDRFGISYKKGLIDICVSLKDGSVSLYDNHIQVTTIDFQKYFIFG